MTDFDKNIPCQDSESLWEDPNGLDSGKLEGAAEVSKAWTGIYGSETICWSEIQINAFSCVTSQLNLRSV